MALTEFDVVREQWNMIELSDGTLVRLRPVILFLSAQKDQVSDTRINIEISCWAKKKGKPSPNPITAERIQQSIVQPNVSFRFLKRGESVYQIQGGGELRIASTPEKFDKSSLVDKDGEPVYLVKSGILIAYLPPGKRSRKKRT